MRAVVLESHGGPEVLTLRDIPAPVPGPEEVVVEVASTALNRADLLQRMGLYPGPPMEHEVPGLEFAGIVADVGARVTTVEAGQPVMGIVGGGSYAERVATHERMLLPVPSGVALADAAAIPEVFITAFDALVVQGGLTSGRTALVHAGASGVGTAAIQIARAIGATVVVTASSGKVERCLELGAHLAIDRASLDGDGAEFVSHVEDLVGRHGVDVVLDVVGGDYLARNLKCLAVGGTIVQVGIMGGGATSIDLGTLLTKRAHLVGTTLRSRPIEQKIAINQRFAVEMLPRFESGDLHPVIDRRFTLDEIAEAHTYLQTNASVGKVVIGVS